MMDNRGQVEPIKEMLVLFIGGPIAIVGVTELVKNTPATWNNIISVLTVIAIFAILVIVHGFVGPRYNRGGSK